VSEYFIHSILSTSFCVFLSIGDTISTSLCFSRFYPAYFRDRYRSRTGKDSENEIGCGFLDWRLGVFYRFWAGMIAERKIAFPTEIGYF